MGRRSGSAPPREIPVLPARDTPPLITPLTLLGVGGAGDTGETPVCLPAHEAPPRDMTQQIAICSSLGASIFFNMALSDNADIRRIESTPQPFPCRLRMPVSGGGIAQPQKRA